MTRIFNKKKRKTRVLSKKAKKFIKDSLKELFQDLEENRILRWKINRLTVEAYDENNPGYMIEVPSGIEEITFTRRKKREK